MNNSTNFTASRGDGDWSMETLVSVYSTIFILSVVGNGLVILALVQNKRMRTVTNVFLLNLAVSDLLLAVFCMPFTLIPLLIKNFIFGPVMCVSIRYAQGTYTILTLMLAVIIIIDYYSAQLSYSKTAHVVMVEVPFSIC